MKILGYTILALAKVIGLVINLYTFVIAAAVLISWVNADPYNPIVRTLMQLTQPVFSRIRRIMPRALCRSRLDLTPIIVLIILILFETIVVNILVDMGRSLIISGKF